VQNSILQWLALKFLDRPLQPRELLTARKAVYVFLILVLFTGSFLWRRYVVEEQAERLAILEQNRGEVELSGAFVRLSLIGSRGLATCVLWDAAIEKQKKQQWNELEVLVNALTKLQPHFITPWLFQSWNLSYNVSVMADRVNDKYFYIARGIELLGRGERQNRDHPDLRFSIGFYTQHKITQSDQTNVLRSLFQLSQIPHNERDPARFIVLDKNTGQRALDEDTGDPLINWAEFEKFCKAHPQLVRRLRHGVRQETPEEQKHLFTCGTAEAVIQFLTDNYNVPSLYKPVPPTPEGVPWTRAKDELLPLEERFPVLPPARSPAPPQTLFKPEGFAELTADAVTPETPLDDSVDAYSVSRAWYGYSLEPIPPADKLPGSTQEVTDRTRQRKPRNMTTLIFRSYPALAESSLAVRLQQEGWFDDEPWVLTGWFPRDKVDGKPVKVGPGPEDRWASKYVWDYAARMWRRHGEDNHLLLTDADKESMEEQASKYREAHHLSGSEMPPPRDPATLSGEEKDGYEATRYLFEYNHYRNVSNFAHHFNRSQVEGKVETLTARKQFFKAETLNLDTHRNKALETYDKEKALGDRTALELWIDVLKAHPQFREDSYIQEQTFEIQLNYMRLINWKYGGRVKGQLAQRLVLLAQLGQTVQPGGWPVTALLPAQALPDKITYPLAFFGAVTLESKNNYPQWHDKSFPQLMAFVKGPFDVTITKEVVEGGEKKKIEEPLISQAVIRGVLERKNLMPRKQPANTGQEQPAERER
jgi:hypothetical protein